VTGNRVVRGQLRFVELQRRKVHDLRVHAILDGQPAGHGLAIALHQPLEQTHPQSFGDGGLADDRRRQLAVIA